MVDCDGVAIDSTHHWTTVVYLVTVSISSHTRPPLTYYYHRGIQHDVHTAAMLVTKTAFLNNKK